MKAAYVAIGLLGLGLGGLWYLGGGTNPPSLLAREGLSVAESVSHRNLTVFFLRGPDRVDDSRVVTLQEALEKGWAVVHETGNVNELQVENQMEDRQLFLQSGDIIKGGKQDRMIATDMLVPPKSGKLPLPSHCVEAGRWTNRGGEAATHFSKSDSYAVGNGIKFANASRNQSEVWRNVSVQQTALSSNLAARVTENASPTSLQLALENESVQRTLGEFEHALRRAGESESGIVGAVFVVNGQVTSAEVYGSNGLFRKVWPRLLKSAAAEAVSTNADGEKHAMSTKDVESFLLAANQENGGSELPNAPKGVVTSDNAFAEFAQNQTEFRSWQMGHRVDLATDNNRTLEKPLPTGGTAGITFTTNSGEARRIEERYGYAGNNRVRVETALYEPAAHNSTTSQETTGTRSQTIDNRQSLQTETRVPANGNALLHRSILKK